MRYKFTKLFLAVCCSSLLAGCVSWTGGVPSAYLKNGTYPVIASIHGIEHLTRSADLSKTTMSYIPTNEIVLDTNTIHGWVIQIAPAKTQLRGQEFYVLPKPGRWDTARAQIVSVDGTTCQTDFIVPKGGQYISDDWGMFPDDPLGKYEIAVFLDGRIAADFKFNVIANRSSPSPTNAFKW